jgi:site-specific DNA-methyltransferase (adenine-specific)
MNDQETPVLPVGDIVVDDCIKTMDAWPADSVDLIFADPPYNIGYAYDGYYDDNRDHAEYVGWTGAWIDACARLLKPSGSFYVLIGDEYAAETRLHLRNLEQDRVLLFRNWIIWHYTFGQNCKLKFNRSHAHLFYCVGSAVFKPVRRRQKAPKGTAGLNINVNDPPFTFNRDAVAVASARQTTYNDRRANPSGKLPDDTWYLRPQEATGICFKSDEDTWYQSRLCGTFKERQQWHPCQLPEALLERIVRVSSNRGDMVFDPFVGSGTTLAVAAKLGRSWLGCELSPEYGARAIERIHDALSPEAKTTIREQGRPETTNVERVCQTETTKLSD